MEEFVDIRPFADDEVPAVLERLLADPEFLQAVCRLKFKGLAAWLGWLLRPPVRRVLRGELKGVRDVAGLQKVMERYMTAMIRDSTAGFSVSGLENLEPGKAHLFIGNHRDIALDPAFTNYALYRNGFDTVRIAIGDNLLTKPYVSDLMRLNKSFIVKRSARGPRQVLKAYRDLSGYIRHSILADNASVWIAQREGRAKSGIDRTEPAIIKMLGMSRDGQSEGFAEYIRSLRIVPVSIAYELDPCDALKAAELQALAERGSYEKAAHEDVASIAISISGAKGHVHIAFGALLDGHFETPAAVAAELDRQIVANYALHATNLYAYETLHGGLSGFPAGEELLPGACGESEFKRRMRAIPADQRDQALGIYANALVGKLEMAAAGPDGGAGNGDVDAVAD